jgi:hypothetical protein
MKHQHRHPSQPGRRERRLGPLAQQSKKRRLGLLDGKFKIPDNFNKPLPDEVIAAFEGRRPSAKR